MLFLWLKVANGVAGASSAQSPNPETFQRTLVQLTHWDAEVRIEGLQRLGRWHEDRCLPWVLTGLKDMEERVCQAAAEMAVQFHDPRVVPALLETFGRHNRQISQTTAQLLSQMTDPEVHAVLTDALRGPDVWVRVGAAQSLGYAKHPEALKVLEAEAKHSDVEVRLAVYWALIALHDPSMNHVLLAGLRDPHPSVRRLAVRTLTQREISPEVIPALAVLLTHDPEADVRKDAAWALGRFGTSHAITALLMGMIELDPESGPAVIEALKAAKDPDVARALASRLKTSIAEEAEFLERIGEPVKIFPGFLQQPSAENEREAWGFYEELKTRAADPILRRTVLSVLAETREEREIRLTAGVLGPRPPFVRAALLVCGHPGPGEAFQRLTLALSSKETDDQMGGLLALCYVEDPRVLPILSQGPFQGEGPLARSAAGAAQYLSTPPVMIRVASKALQWLEDPDQNLRLAAVSVMSQSGYTHPYFVKVLRKAARNTMAPVAQAALAALAEEARAQSLLKPPVSPSPKSPGPAPRRKKIGPPVRGTKSGG